MGHCYLTERSNAILGWDWVNGYDIRFLIAHPNVYSGSVVFRLPLERPSFEDTTLFEYKNCAYHCTMKLYEYPFVSFKEILSAKEFPYEEYYHGYYDALGEYEPDFSSNQKLYNLGWDEGIMDLELKAILSLRDS